jgi:hypothetical protein
MTATINREWIAAELSKGIEAEQALAAEARMRAEVPPDPALGVLYHEIAAADDRHRGVVETVATRYGYNPTRTVPGGLGEVLTRLKDKVSEIATTPLERLGHDLAAKANAIHWYTAWVTALEALGEDDNARALATVLDEEKAHRDALQLGLTRLIEAGARGEPPAEA